jgi:hypothetical protein
MEVATELPLAKACNTIPRAGHDVERLWRDCALRRSWMIRGLSARELTTVREDSEPMRWVLCADIVHDLLGVRLRQSTRNAGRGHASNVVVTNVTPTPQSLLRS